jgi:hypothetical protein
MVPLLVSLFWPKSVTDQRYQRISRVVVMGTGLTQAGFIAAAPIGRSRQARPVDAYSIANYGTV